MNLTPEMMNDIRDKLEELSPAPAEVSVMASHDFQQIARDLQAQQTIIANAEAELHRARAYVLELEGAMKSLATVAEDKIVELKIALDRKAAHAQTFEVHLRNAVRQNENLRSENVELKKLLADFNSLLS